MADEEVWIDFDRKADISTSHRMLADEILSITLWVKEVHAITEAGEATIRVIGLR